MLTAALSTAPSQPTQDEHQQAIDIPRIKPKDWSGKHKTYNLLEEDNWQSWRDDISLTFGVCGLNGYVNGTLKCPDSTTNPVNASNWKYNDLYTQKVIHNHLSTGQKYHTSNCDTAKEMWCHWLGYRLIYQALTAALWLLVREKEGKGEEDGVALTHKKNRDD